MTNTLSLLPSVAVVIAHGPTGATLTALNRAASMMAHNGRLVVIAGTEPGMTAVERASERGYAVVEDHGPEALGRLLGSLDGPTLVLHDDVAVNSHTIANLMLTHNRTGLPVVPGTGRRCPERELDEANLGCVLGTAADLAELAAQSAFGPGRRVLGRFIAAADSQAAHSADCGRRLVEDRATSDRPLLVAALIVRDESEFLAECLRSLDPVVDRIEVVDTGSTDDTVAIARAHGAHVVQREWRDDFAWARNQVLENCRDAAYMLWVDADERFHCEDPTTFRRTLRTFEQLYPSYRIDIRNLADDHETHMFSAVRLARPSGTEFTGAVHERLTLIGGEPLLEVALGKCHLDHLGYAEHLVNARAKSERNLRIAQASYEREPTSERAIHYARSLVATGGGAPAETLALLEPLLDAAELSIAGVESMMMGLWAKVLLENDDIDTALGVALIAAELVPADAVAGAVLAEATVRAGRPEEALEVALALMDRPSPPPLIVDNTAASTRARILFDLAVALDRPELIERLIVDLPPDFDPWPTLAAAFGTGWVGDKAECAGRQNDERILAAMAMQPDVTRTLLDHAADQFIAAGGTIHDSELMAGVTAALDLVEAAPDLRDAFARSGQITDAVAFASALATGHVDLDAELETAAEHQHGAAVALGIAAEALQRRGRGDEAVECAIEAAQLWPGSLRAAVLVAASANQQGMPEAALEMVRAARAAGGDRLAPRARRHELNGCAVDAHLALGDVPSAVGEAFSIVDDRGQLQAWPAMLQIAVEDSEKMALVLGLALLSDGNDFLAAAAANLRPDKTAELCLAYLLSGGLNPDAVSIGLLAATLRDRVDLADMLTEHAHRLERDTCVQLAERIRDAGQPGIAARLEEVAGTVGA